MRPYSTSARKKSTLIPRLTLLVGAIAALAWLGAWISTPDGAKGTAFTVAQGDTTKMIATHLKEDGVIRSTLLFRYALKRSGLATKLQPGTYDLGKASSMNAVILTLTSGGVSASENVLLVKEGENLSDIREQLYGLDISDDLFRITGVPAVDARTFNSDQAPWAKDYSSEYPFLKDKPAYVSLEGFLFPDTYRLYKDATAEDLVKKMLGNFDKKLTPELRAKIAAQHKTIYDVVTLASVVESEVQGDEDRRKVADLFWRRLEAGMALQSDATVNYVTGKGHAAVSLDDTANVSTYNTYKWKGLPLGPICNPGLSAIEAVISPQPNDAWYFLTDEEGGVHYARTFEEHIRNKQKYLR